MQLPAHPQGGVQVGISDILAWRECARRMQWGMRRHLASGDPPENQSPESAYGSAVHQVLALLDDGDTVQAAIQAAFTTYKQWLEPSDLSRLRVDAEKYLGREMVGVRTLLNEGEVSIPLFEHPTAGRVWFRARIDRLYQSLDDPGRLIHIDYKSSKWPRSYEQVGSDLQLWAYNLCIYEWFTNLYPEIDRLELDQVYDQLNYGEIPTRKSAAQRAEIRTWLIAAVTALLDDDAAEPTYNEWCPWCPLKMDCPVVQDQLTDWALSRIAALMPREERLNQDGSVSKRPGKVLLDPERIGEYVDLLPTVKRAGTTLERFAEEVTDVLRQMPDSELARLGKRKSERQRRGFTTSGKRAIVDLIGLPRALMLFDLSLAAVERFFGAHSSEAAAITELAESQTSYTAIADA